MVLAFVNSFSHHKKLVSAAFAARSKLFNLTCTRSASIGIRLPGVSNYIFPFFF